MDEQRYITIAKVLDGEATAAEQQELKLWLEADAANVVAYEEMKTVWQQADQLFAGPEFDTTAAWDKVAAQLSHNAPAAKPPAKVIGFPVWLRNSLAVAAVLLIGIFAYRMWDGREVTVVAMNGNQTIELPDHSLITLKKGSTIHYPKQFAQASRNVSLEGEAFFDVTKNPAQPFVIRAQAIDVRVLGTSFNVRTNDTAATVVVATGRVEVTDRKSVQKVTLTPGMKGTLAAGKLEEGTVTNKNYLFWKTGELVFDNNPLSEVVAAISTAKDTAINLSIPADQQQQLVQISFRSEHLEEMLTELCMITRCDWKKEGNTYIIRKK